VLFVVALALSALLSPIHAYPTEVLGAAPGANYNALTRLAMTVIGEQQGECFPWVKRVVQAATGIVIGRDYRLGYLDAGLVEVPAAQARNGDIIQIANDANTRPDADYPGLHTAFILESEGGGTFRVIDSNALYDGVVRVRRGYDPAATAARYPGVSFHIYRLPAATSGGITPTPPSSLVNTPGIIPIGSAAEIAADGDCLRVRSIAGLSGAVLGCLPTGARVTVTQPGPDVDGYHWVTITTGGVTGWASERYLRALGPTTAAVATPTPPPTTGRIVSGIIPPKGVGLIVFGGGTEAQLLTASGCPSETASFWASKDGRFVQLIPGVTIPIVNAAWREVFPGNVPSNLALMASCRPDEPAGVAPATVTSSPAPAPAADVAPTAPVAASTPVTTTYVVEAGDSLSGIAERIRPAGTSFGEFLERLYAANGLTEASTIAVGQTLLLPAGAPADTPPPGSEASTPSSAAAAPAGAAGALTTSAAPSTYTVEAGDSLSAIAERFRAPGASIGDVLDMLYAVNGLTEESPLQVGQTLRILH
jgi:LysM repeat protein